MRLMGSMGHIMLMKVEYGHGVEGGWVAKVFFWRYVRNYLYLCGLIAMSVIHK